MIDKLKRILVVEDEFITAQILRLNLEVAGYVTTIVEGGFDAWLYAQERHFDLVITDYCLPEIMGTDLCRHLRRDEGYSKTPIILVTAFDRDLDVVGLQDELHLSGVFPKPNNPADIVSRVRECLADCA